MPLFGHKNKKRTPSPLGGTNATRNDPAYGQTAGNATTGSNWDQNNASANTNPTNDPGFNDHNSYGSQKGGGTTANQRSGFGADYAQGPGSAAGDTAAGGTTGTGIGSGGTGVHHRHHGAGAGAGATVGSAALREQAMMREREAENYKAQSQELLEAERLEQQAREHRERAVAQGAHPANKHLAGGNLAHSGQSAGVDQSRGGNY